MRMWSTWIYKHLIFAGGEYYLKFNTPWHLRHSNGCTTFKMNENPIICEYNTRSWGECGTRWMLAFAFHFVRFDFHEYYISLNCVFHLLNIRSSMDSVEREAWLPYITFSEKYGYVYHYWCCLLPHHRKYGVLFCVCVSFSL